jgi:hypothetical protein
MRFLTKRMWSIKRTTYLFIFRNCGEDYCFYIETKYWMKMMWMTCTCLKCFTIPQIFHIQINTIQTHRGRRGHDCMAVGFTITYAISAYYHWCCEFKSRSGRGVQQYVIKFVGALRHVGGFHRVLRFSPPIKFTATI